MSDENSIISDMKKCSTCGETKTVDKFSKKSRMKDGLNSQCKSCQSDYYKRFYAENREDQIARSRKYKEQNPLSNEKREDTKRKHREWWALNKTDISKRRIDRYWDESSGIRSRNIERCRSWVKENIARVCTQMKKYYKINSEKVKARVRQYENENPEKTKALGRVKANRRRARLLNSANQYKRQDVERIFYLQKGKCANCKCSISKKYHIDHRIPVARGGDNSPGNIELLCPSCNLKKSAKMPHEFAQENGRLI